MSTNKSLSLGQIVFNQLTRKNNWITEFETIKKSIPKPWLSLLKDNILEKNELKKIEDNTELYISHKGIYKNRVEIEPIMLKMALGRVMCTQTNKENDN